MGGGKSSWRTSISNDSSKSSTEINEDVDTPPNDIKHVDVDDDASTNDSLQSKGTDIYLCRNQL